MYKIIKTLTGKYYCEGMLQDSTERWEEETLDEAIESMKEFARYGNHANIKTKDISFFIEEKKLVEQYNYVKVKRKAMI